MACIRVKREPLMTQLFVAEVRFMFERGRKSDDEIEKLNDAMALRFLYGGGCDVVVVARPTEHGLAHLVQRSQALSPGAKPCRPVLNGVVCKTTNSSHRKCQRRFYLTSGDQGHPGRELGLAQTVISSREHTFLRYAWGAARQVPREKGALGAGVKSPIQKAAFLRDLVRLTSPARCQCS